VRVAIDDRRVVLDLLALRPPPVEIYETGKQAWLFEKAFGRKLDVTYTLLEGENGGSPRRTARLARPEAKPAGGRERRAGIAQFPVPAPFVGPLRIPKNVEVNLGKLKRCPSS
jgi:hypothetical protein